MGIFDILAEMKIAEWLKQPEEQRVKNDEKLEPKQSYEMYQLDQIKLLIEKAATESGDTRKQTMRRVNSLQIQLLVSLEQGGYRMMAQEMEKRILRHKLKHLH